MLVLGFVLFTLLTVGVCIFLYREGMKEAARKEATLNKIRVEVDDAVKRQNVGDLRRIRLLYNHKLNELDEGLSQRLDELADTLDIQNYDRK